MCTCTLLPRSFWRREPLTPFLSRNEGVVSGSPPKGHSRKLTWQLYLRPPSRNLCGCGYLWSMEHSHACKARSYGHRCARTCHEKNQTWWSCTVSFKSCIPSSRWIAGRINIFEKIRLEISMRIRQRAREHYDYFSSTRRNKTWPCVQRAF